MRHVTLALAGPLIVLSCAQAQDPCAQSQVMHLSGAQIVGGTNVMVSSVGAVDVNTTYCTETLPYWIGHSPDSAGSDNGAYIFDFDPPVDSVRLNFSAISQVGVSEELVLLYVNGAHYAIPEAGSPQVCDPMAVLTPEGNLHACAGCSGAGWAGTVVPGPVGTLTVMDSVISGNPSGSCFSLFICELANGLQDNALLYRPPYPNPASDVLILEGRNALHLEVTLVDLSGRSVPFPCVRSAERITINTAQLAPGSYAVIVGQGASRAVHRVVIGARE